MNKFITVLIIFGHGGNDVGAVANGLCERDINIIQGKECGRVLQEHGFNVKYDTLNSDVNAEVNIINNVNADVTINIHNNAGGGDGFEAFCFSRNTKAKNLCQCIEKEVIAIGQNSRGIKNGDKLAVIRKTTPLTILLEGAFLDSNDRFIIDTIEEQKNFGLAYAKGILNYFGVQYNSKKSDSFNVCASELFNEKWYLWANPDVYDSVNHGGFKSGHDHYIRYGKHEGRKSLPPVPKEYNENDYLMLNPDVLNAVNDGVFTSGIHHYLLHGFMENRRYCK